MTPHDTFICRQHVRSFYNWNTSPGPHRQAVGLGQGRRHFPPFRSVIRTLKLSNALTFISIIWVISSQTQCIVCCYCVALLQDQSVLRDADETELIWSIDLSSIYWAIDHSLIRKQEKGSTVDDPSDLSKSMSSFFNHSFSHITTFILLPPVYIFFFIIWDLSRLTDRLTNRGA